MTPLCAFGLFAVTMMLVCYAYENRSRWFIFAFAIACALGSTYGFRRNRASEGFHAGWSSVQTGVRQSMRQLRPLLNLDSRD